MIAIIISSALCLSLGFWLGFHGGRVRGYLTGFTEGVATGKRRYQHPIIARYCERVTSKS